MRYQKLYSFLVICCIFQLKLDAQYYDGITPTATCAALKTELSNLICTNVSYQEYGEVSNIMCTITDVDANGNLIDRYTTIMSYDCSDAGSNSSSEGNGWNREHIFANSWFGGNSNPAFSDLFNLFPSDIYVNSLKANLPLGEVSSNTVLGLTLSKIGPDANGCSNNCNSGASGDVFEPADQYKGDFARAFLYMAVKYEGQAMIWEDESACGDQVMTGDPFKFYTSCYLNLMIKWHVQDPPDQLELDRNNAIFNIQGNRNPFIDNPQYATDIWGNNCCPSCDPFTVEATPACSSIGNTFDINYTISGSAVGPFTITESATNTTFNGLTASGTIAALPYTPTSQNNKVTLTIIDEATSCSINYDVLQLSCVESLTCDCNNHQMSISAQAAGNGQDHSMVYVLVDATGNVQAIDQDGTFPGLAGNVTMTVYAFNVADVDVNSFTQSVLLAGNVTNAIAEAAPFDEYCYAYDSGDFNCMCPTCADIIVDATTICDVGSESYSIVINSITGGDALNGDYEVEIDGTTYTYPDDFPLTGQLYSGDDQSSITLTITDANNTMCSTTFNVFELNCAPLEECDCTNDPNSLTIITQASGNADGFSMVYVLFDASGNYVTSNHSGSFAGLLGDGTSYTVFAINYDDADAAILADLSAGLTISDLTSGTGNFLNYCYELQDVTLAEFCNCGDCEITPEAPADIICDDNNTPDVSTDDTFTFSVVVNGANTMTNASGTFSDNQGNAGLAYGDNVFYGPYLITGGSITINYTDTDDSSCGSSLVVSPPASCSFPCSILPEFDMVTCNDNGTPDDPTDDTYTFELTIAGDNADPAASDTATDSEGNSVSYTSVQTYGPYLIADGSTTISFTDNENPLCMGSVTVPAPVTCSVSCSIENPSAMDITCDDSGTPNDSTDDTFTFNATIVGLNTAPSASNTFNDSEGNSGIAYGSIVNYGPYLISLGTVTIDYEDEEDGDCINSLVVDPPASCSTPDCTDIVIDAFTECGANNTYTVVIASISGGDGVGGTYIVTINGDDYSYPSEFPLTGLEYSGNNQTAIILDVVDADNSDCTGSFAVFELNCVDQFSCDCDADPVNSLTISVQALGNANGYSMFYVLVDANGIVLSSNGSGTFSGLQGNSTNYTVYAVNYDDLDVVGILGDIGSLNGNLVTPLISTTSPFDVYCYTTQAAPLSNDCGCTLPVCEITLGGSVDIMCNDNGTPENPDDDTYTFDVLLNGENTNPGASMSATDDQGNTIMYGSTQSYGPFLISDGNTTIMYTDVDDASCILELIAEAPLPCSFSCSITLAESTAECNDNGTPDDPADDTYTFDINVDGMNSNIGASNTATDNLGNTVSYGEDQQYGPFLITAGDMTITFTDVDDPMCTAMVLIPAPMTCSISCTMIAESANINCDDNGTPNDPDDDTYTFDITVNGSNTDPAASNSFDDDQGNTGIAYGSTVSYGPYDISNGSVTINYSDADGGIDCDETVTVNAPPSCSVPACSDIVVDATTECAADGTYTIVINSITGGDDVGVNYIINIAGTDYDLSDFPLTVQVYSGGNQAGVILFISDADSPSCTGQFTVFELNCLPQEVCDCSSNPVNSLTINAQATGNANGFLMLYVLVDSSTGNVISFNSTGSFPGLLGDNTSYTVYAVNYDINDDIIINDIDDLIGSDITPLITNVAPFDSYCYTTMMAEFSEDCGCVFPMCSITPEDASNIVCDDNGTPEDPTDDTFTFDVVVNGSNTFTGASNTCFDDQGNTAIAYGSTLSYGPYPIAGGPITINYTDTDDASCANMIVATEPAVCSMAGCSDIVVEATTVCDPNGAETFSIDIQSITGGDGVGSNYNVTIDGTVFFYPADFPLTGLTYSGTGVQPKITMLIEDADDTSCTLSYDVFELNCTAQETCDCDDNPFSYEIQVQAAADANGFDLVYILTDGATVIVNLDGNFPALMGAANAYTVHAVHVESIDLATILSVSTQADLDELIAHTGAFATSCYTINSQNFTGDCGCSTDCAINNVMISTICDGSFEGTYDIEICFNVSNPASSEFTVSIAGQDVGPFAYSSLDAGGCIVLTVADIALVGDGDTNVPILIFDGSTGTAIDPFISEFHYDDDSTDDNEGVEITGMDGFDLTGYQLIAYNGSGGADYRTVNLSGTISGVPCGSLFFEINGLQNGPDGFALVDPDGNVIEFISYEGVFVATSGPATGITSTDIGVAESNAGLDTESLQLTDAGWVGPITASPNQVNDNLTCGSEASTCMAESSYDELPCFDPCSVVVVPPILPETTESCTIEDLFVSIEPGEVLQPVPASQLFFSEYIEGSSNNKCFEIFNGTGVPVDLTGWSVSVYTNGNSSPSNSTLPAGVILADGDVFVVCNTNADPEALAVTDANIGGVTGFNGNDDLALVNPDGEIVDFIGTVSTLLNFGTDVTLVRDCSIVEGRTDSTSLFIATDEWFVLATDDFSNLGTHSYCGVGFVPENCTFNVYLQDPATGATAVLTDVEEGFDVEDIPVDIANDQNFFITCVNEFGCESAASSTKIFIQDLGTIACEDLVQVSLGSPCDYQIPGSLLFSDGRDISFYDLTLTDEDGDTLFDDVVTRDEGGQTLDYKLTDLCSGVSCWGQVKVELKRKPIVTGPCSFIPGSEQSVAGSFSDAIDDEYSFEVIDDCQTVTIIASADPKYSCGTQTEPDWCNGTFSVTVWFHDILVYTESGIVDETSIILDHLQLGDFVVLIEADDPSTQGNYAAEIVVSTCDPPIDCILTCAVNDPIDSVFFGRLVQPSNGFLTRSEVYAMLDTMCFQEVLEMRQTIEESGDKCSGGIRREVTYTGLIEGAHGELEKVEIIKQVYKEVQTPFDTIQVPHNLDLPCDAPNHPDSIFNRFFIENNSIADSIAISNAYPYVFLKGILGGQIIRSVQVEVPVIDHYQVNIDTVKVERLINDEWLLVELINKELRDSIRYVEVTKWAYVLIPFTPQNPKCDYVLNFDDVIVPKCGNEVLTLRTWTFIDWCTQEIKTLPVQRIRNIDSGPMLVDSLIDQTISIDPYVCTASFELPTITGVDACGTDDGLAVEWKTDEGRIADGYVLDLWESNSPVTLVATISDVCGNSVKDTMLLEINDFVPPTAICYSELEVGITDGGLVLFDAIDFDNGSHDFGCGDVWVKAIRVENLRGTTNGYWNRNGVDRQPDYSLGPDPSFTFRYTCGNEDSDDFTALYRKPETLRILGVDIGKQVFYDDQLGICCDDVDSEDIYVRVRVFDVDPGEGPVDPRRMEVEPTGPIYVKDRLDKDRLTATTNSVRNDLFGHFTDCIVKLNFTNKLAPQLTCQNYSIDCLTDLSSIPPPVSRGGVCGTSPAELVSQSEFTNSCGNGDIIQEWYIDTDDQTGFTEGDERCIQIISVNEGPGQFDPYTIKWPRHMDGTLMQGINLECAEDTVYMENIDVQMGEAMNCIPSFDSESDQAVWCAPSCALVGYTVDVDTIEASDVCLKILRNHTIIDWCLWEPNGSNPEMDSDQFIVVEDWAQGECISCENGETPIAGGADRVYLKYTEVETDGYYNYSQVLKVVDTTRPDVLVQDTFYVDILGQGDKSGVQEDCQASGLIIAVAEDFCGLESTTEVLLAWDVTVFDQNETVLFSQFQLTDSFSFLSPEGMDDDVYRVEWEVRDGCGNSSTAQSLIVFNDVAAPVPLCVQGTTTAFLQAEDEVTIWAKDFDLGSYDACSDIRFSIVGRGAEPIKPGESAFDDQQSITIECEVFVDVAQLDVWVWDSSGNGQKCPVNVVINETCEEEEDIPEGSALITGVVQTESGVGIEAAEISIHTSAPEYPITTNTSSGGVYSFINNPFGLDYELDVYKTGDYLNGVSTSDLLGIQRHILNQVPLDSPYKLIAADVNNDQKISGLDIVTLRNVILGLSRRFANNTSWRFVDAAYQFEDPQNPWPFTETIYLDRFREAMLDQNYIGVKIGDVNDNVQANSTLQANPRQLQNIEFTSQDQYFETDDIISVPIYNIGPSLNGFQFTLEHPDLQFLDIEPGSLKISRSNLGRHNDQTTFSYYGADQHTPEDVLFTLVFRTKDQGSLSNALHMSSAITRAEGYQENAEVNEITLQVMQDDISVVELYQNTPNPFSESTNIEFYLPTSMSAQLIIYTVHGHQLLVIDEVFEKGAHQISISADHLSTSGIYYYELKTPGVNLYKKMLFVD